MIYFRNVPNHVFLKIHFFYYSISCLSKDKVELGRCIQKLRNQQGVIFFFQLHTLNNLDLLLVESCLFVCQSTLWLPLGFVCKRKYELIVKINNLFKVLWVQNFDNVTFESSLRPILCRNSLEKNSTKKPLLTLLCVCQKIAPNFCMIVSSNTVLQTKMFEFTRHSALREL